MCSLPIWIYSCDPNAYVNRFARVCINTILKKKIVDRARDLNWVSRRCVRCIGITIVYLLLSHTPFASRVKQRTRHRERVCCAGEKGRKREPLRFSWTQRVFIDWFTSYADLSVKSDSDSIKKPITRGPTNITKSNTMAPIRSYGEGTIKLLTLVIALCFCIRQTSARRYSQLLVEDDGFRRNNRPAGK